MENPTVVFPGPKQVIIEDRPRPTLEAGEVLLQTRCSLISTGTELTIFSGEYPADSLWATRWGKFPATPGYSNIADVVEIAPDVDPSWLGRRVASGATHRRYMNLPTSRINLIQHPEIPDEDASFFTISGIVMNGVRRAQVKWGDSVVIFGMGLLGQMTARYCRLSGAWPVICVDVSDARLAMLPDDPGIIRVNPRERAVLEVVEEATRGRKADCAFELTGNQDLIPQEITVVRRQGRFAILSSPRGNTDFNFCDLCHYPSITIIGIHTLSHPAVETLDYQWTFERHTELFFDYLAAGQVQTAPLITHRAPWSQAPEMFQMLLADRSAAMGVVLDWTAE
ncbi:MAG TPA: zinc-binding alcohol dehydrogenase [Armatimonadota bacterium]